MHSVFFHTSASQALLVLSSWPSAFASVPGHPQAAPMLSLGLLGLALARPLPTRSLGLVRAGSLTALEPHAWRIRPIACVLQIVYVRRRTPTGAALPTSAFGSIASSKSESEKLNACGKVAVNCARPCCRPLGMDKRASPSAAQLPCSSAKGDEGASKFEVLKMSYNKRDINDLGSHCATTQRSRSHDRTQ